LTSLLAINIRIYRKLSTEIVDKYRDIVRIEPSLRGEILARAAETVSTKHSHAKACFNAIVASEPRVPSTTAMVFGGRSQTITPEAPATSGGSWHSCFGR